MALWITLLKLCDKQNSLRFFPCAAVYLQYIYHLIHKQLLVSFKTSWFIMTSSSPSDITWCLLFSLDVSHRAIAIAKRLNSHQIIAAVTCLPGLVEVGEGCHYIRQRTKVALRWVILLIRGQFTSILLITRYQSDVWCLMKTPIIWVYFIFKNYMSDFC